MAHEKTLVDADTSVYTGDMIKCVLRPVCDCELLMSYFSVVFL